MMYINGVWMGVYEIIYTHRCMDVYQCDVHGWVYVGVWCVCVGGGGGGGRWRLMYMYSFSGSVYVIYIKRWVGGCLHDVLTQVCG